MTRTLRWFRVSFLAGTLLCGVLQAPLLRAQTSAGQNQERGGLPPGVELEFERSRVEDGGRTLVFEGPVVLTYRQGRFQADRMIIRDRRYIEAEGNVLVAWDQNRIFGLRMTYDMEQDRGVIEQAQGRVDPEFYFTAERVEKIGEDRVFLKDATVTTCTQPVPYWSFSVSSARVRIAHYAHLRNLRLKAKRLPLVYLPYLIWPVKRDRSAGLLFPQFGSTRNRGEVFSQGLFLPLGRSADLTLVGEYYTLAGFGGGAELRFVPNAKGSGFFSGFFIQDKIAGSDRWRLDYRQAQTFRNGFRMVADITEVSDFDYFSDFERDLRLVSTPTVLARVEFARNGRWTSVNVRELRREQLVAGGTLTQQTLPELEFRGRSRRLGRTPLYLSYESSFTSIQQQGVTIDADYLRADLFPTLSLPLSPVPWLDLNADFSYRLTYYSQRRDPSNQEILDDALVRGVGGAGLEIVGPKFARLFGRLGESGRPKYKHTVEPRISYGYRESFTREDEVVRFDEVDLIPARNLLSYGLRTRLFAKRPRSAIATAPDLVEGPVVMPDGRVYRGEGESAPESGEAAPATEPVEVLQFELSQSRTLEGGLSLSFADLDRDGVNEATSPSSSVSLSGRINPSRALSLDLRSRYHVLYKKIQDVTLSGNVRREAVQAGFSIVHREGLGVRRLLDGSLEPLDDDTQMRLNTALKLWNGRVRVGLEGAFDADPLEGRSHVPDRRVRLEFYTQCCGILAEYLARDFSLSTRRDFRFTVDLRGIGKFLDLHQGSDR